ncbi:uncharacterized protein LOC143482650 [Brachyhypopomus gauderio]|uniref:uncharacterized protein LOC143482650 n=1 Tax=Brachyhypopomus gauderio TaxID=698409 RepID=UPI00404175C9
MVSQGVQILGALTALVGCLGVMVTCGLPMWRVTAFIGANIVTAQLVWEGIWMTCVVQSTGQMQCKIYDTVLALSSDLQAARAMIIISILFGVFGVVVSIAGGKCTNCIEDMRTKAVASIVAGVLFLISGLLCLIPVSWTAQSVISDFYNPALSDAQRRELFVMGRIAKEVSGQTLCFIGLVGLCLCCGLPMWRTTYYIGSNIVSGQIVWDGLWMNCVMQSTGQMQCKMESSIMSLMQDLQAARALTIIAIIVAAVGVLLTFVGGRCSSCLKNESSMAKMVILGGALCIVAAVICIIPVSWSAAYTISDYYNVLTPTSAKRELGGCIYIGWGTAAILIIGGVVLCSSCPPQEDAYMKGMYPYQSPMMAPGPYMPVRTYSPNVPYTGPYVPNKSYPATYVAAPRQYP